MIERTNVKINLGLHVLHKREDGFHDLETVFLPYCGYGDILEISPSACTSIHIGGPCYGGWDKDSDLTVKAYRLLAEKFGLPPVEINLTKNAPVGAGLGGGSADAAVALKMLDSLFELGLSTEELEKLAGQLGSDCAFFIQNRPSFARGRGEILSACPICLDDYEIRVEIPEGESVSTREAYANIVPRDRWDCALPSLAEVLSLPVRQWREHLHNDFEQSVFPAHPSIAALKEKFYAQGAEYASMSGSGAAVFALFRK